MSGAFMITGGTIQTMDPARPEVEAVGVIGDKIVAVGNRRLVEDALPQGYRVLDLKGQFCMPGFNEAHSHLIGFGFSSQQVVARYPDVKTIEDIKHNIAERVRTTPPGTWIQGRGYDDNKLDERRHPTRTDFDAVSPDHPVIVVNGSGHMCVVNSVALRLAGVDRNTPDPDGGHIVRDEHGEPTGLLQEHAQELVRHIIPEPTVEDRVAALGRCSAAYVAAGITSSQDASVSQPEQLAAYQIAVGRNTLRPRMSLMFRDNLLPHFVALGIKQGFGDNRLRIGPMKMFIDGSLIGRTAAVSQPWLEDPRDDNYGLTMLPVEEYNDIVWQAHRAGFQVATHAVGDRGIELAVDAYTRANERDPRPDPRHRIEHGNMQRPDLIDRIAKAGIMIVNQPIMIHDYGDGFMRHMGMERTQLCLPFRTFLDAGIKVAFSSDAPVAAFEPLKGVQTAVTERTGSGKSFSLEEALSVEESLSNYTVSGAYSTFEEHRKGQLREDMLADFAILAQDPRAVEHEAISSIHVSQTIIGGETVYEG